MANGVLILAEVADGDVVAITKELIGAAQRLNAGPVSAMLIGSGVEGAASKVMDSEVSITSTTSTEAASDTAFARKGTLSMPHTRMKASSAFVEAITRTSLRASPIS